MSVALCPSCGKVISLSFPIHDCKPTPNFKRTKWLCTMNEARKAGIEEGKKAARRGK